MNLLKPIIQTMLKQIEKKIWSVWSKHPNNNGLTDKMEFGTELMQFGDYNLCIKEFLIT